MPVFAASLLSPNFGLIIWIAIVFTILLVLLRKFAWGPITSALAEREQTIDTSIRRAEVALAEAKQIQAENERARREAEQEAQRLLREAREAADKLRADEIDRTRQQIAQLQQQAETEIERQKQGALETLRAEVAALAVDAAEKILREKIDGQQQRRLVNDFVNTLPQN